MEAQWLASRLEQGRSIESIAREAGRSPPTVAEAGGCCALCGYAELPGALHFHHVDPATKSFALGATGVTRSLAKARAEAAKCVLLCARCHGEVELGVKRLPLRPMTGGEAVA